MLKKLIFLTILFMPLVSNAWMYNTNAKIKEFVQWESEEGTGYAVLMLNDVNETICHVPLSQKELYSLVLSLYASGRTFHIHCYDEVQNIGGYESRRVHRINAI